ncbi:MAG: hypothetical protein ACKPCI_06745, partial [Dolichospermum sp.]
ASGNFHINRYKGKFNAYQRTYIVTSKNNIYLEYLYQVLKEETQLLKNQGKGSQTKFLTLGMLTGIKIFTKTSDLISKFYELVDPIYTKIHLNNQPKIEVNTLHLDPKNNLWIGTAGNGVFRINLSTSKIVNFTKKEGLSNETIAFIFND